MENSKAKLSESVINALSTMIISASGWRKVFSIEGDEGRSEQICNADAIIAGCAALALTMTLKPTKTVLLGTDTRPTGRPLAQCAASMFHTLGIPIRFVGVSAAPEFMAESRQDDYDFFFYISASHNPIGHNGFKFGRNGGVFTKKEVQPVVDCFTKLAEDIDQLEFVQKSIKGPMPEIEGKDLAVSHYRDFVLLTIAGSKQLIPSLISNLRSCPSMGVAVDFNGSARTVSIDRAIFDELGILHSSINDQPGEIAHAIVPEGKNLEYCRNLLEKKHAEDSSFILGYTPDNDGDRGNLVYIDDDGKSRILAAQTVFALVVLCQLATSSTGPLAVAANGPTSMRIEDIASRFNAVCFRSEVGEANAVALAEELRSQGYVVPILGEGSNGGSIVHPSKVRDPLDSILSLLKFLSDKSAVSSWLGKDTCTIGELVRSLPVYTTTDAFSPLAGMKVRTNDFGSFKTHFEALWQKRFNDLSKLGISSYEEYQLEGTSCNKVSGPEGRSGNCRGGMKFMLNDMEGNCIGFVWFRPSGTEPLLRLLVDVKGSNQQLHDKLLAFERELLEETDNSLLKA